MKIPKMEGTQTGPIELTFNTQPFKIYNYVKYRIFNSPEQSPIDPEKNNAHQEREYRKDKRDGKIDDAEE